MKLLISLVVSVCITLTASAAGTPGLNYNYYEGNWDSLPNFFALTPIKKGTSANIDLSVRKKNESFAFLWQGEITIPLEGDYTFNINSDDGSKLYIGTYNNSVTPLINNDGMHANQTGSGTIKLKAGIYPITIAFFQNNGGQTMELFWSSNKGLARQKVPDNVLTHASSLSYSYYEGIWNELPDFNSLKPVKKGAGKNFDLSVSNKTSNYGIVWKGLLTIPADGNYTFEIISDDGSQLYLDTSKTPLVDNNGLHISKSASGTVSLPAGTYPLTLSFFQNSGGQELKVYWRSNTGISRQVIPDIAFKNTSKNVNYSYYEGTWNALPDFSTLTPIKTGMESNLDLNMRKRENSYGVVWKSFINIPATADYTFETNSDDGSKVYIDNSKTPLINNDGLHAPNSVKGSMRLNKGIYPITVSFFQNDGGNTMQLYWASNAGIIRQLVPDRAFTAAIPTIDITTKPDTPVNIITQVNGLKGNHNYYFSISKGDDSRTSVQAQDSATPWKTLTKLNAFTDLLPGDAVLFKRGEVFDGFINVLKSGAAGASITFSSYGSGARPIINGFKTITGWTSLGGNIYEAPFASGGYLSLVTINNKIQTKGRYPNTEYLTVDSRTIVDGPSPIFMGPGTFTDAELPASLNNWTGAEVVIRKNDYVLDRCQITGHSGNTVSYYSPSPHTPVVGYGYFIQNDVRTLDSQGEWFYDAKNHTIKLYSLVHPSTLAVKASSVSSLVTIDNKSNLIFDNLQFQGSDTSTINITNQSSDITIQNCDIDFSGISMLNASNSHYISFIKSSVSNSNSPSVYMVDCSNSLIKDNDMKNMGLRPGMGLSTFAGYGSVYIKGSYTTVERNRIDSVGYNGIVVTGGSNILVKNNFVSNFCMVLSDGGGIYTNADDDFLGRQIIGNVIVNGKGSFKGTTATTPRAANGIYLDELGSNVEVADNTIYNCVSNGIYLHQAYKNVIKGNTLVNNGVNAISIVDDMPETARTHNNIVKGNILYSKTTIQNLLHHGSTQNDLTLFGQFDSNFYCRPFNIAGYISTQFKNPNEIYSFYDVDGWNEAYKDRGIYSTEAAAIKEYTVTSTGINRIVNGTFDNNVDIVSVDPSISVTLDTKLDGKAAKISNKGNASQEDNVTVIDIGPVTVGTIYRVKFSLLGSKGTQNLISYVRSYNHTNYPIVSDIKYVGMRTTRTECEYFYKVTSNETDVKLTFVANGNLMPYWIDNVEVTPVEASLTNIDDSIRFEYNGSNTAKTILLNGAYTDYKKVVYTNQVSIAPYSSVLLFKAKGQTGNASNALSDSGKTMLTAVILNNTKPVSKALIAAETDKGLQKSSIYPNPVINVLAARLSTTKTGTVWLFIYDQSGKIIQSSSYLKNEVVLEKTMNVSALLSGIYYLNVKFSDGTSIIKPFVKY